MNKFETRITTKTAEERAACNAGDEVFRDSKGRFITKDFAEAMGLSEITMVQNADGKITKVIEHKGETPLEMPTMNFAPDEKHHKKVHNTLITQIPHQEKPLEMPVWD